MESRALISVGGLSPWEGQRGLGRCGNQHRLEQPHLAQDPPEEPGVLHIVGIFIVRLLAPNAHPEEVFRLFSLVDDL